MKITISPVPEANRATLDAGIVGDWVTSNLLDAERDPLFLSVDVEDASVQETIRRETRLGPRMPFSRC